MYRIKDFSFCNAIINGFLKPNNNNNYKKSFQLLAATTKNSTLNLFMKTTSTEATQKLQYLTIRKLTSSITTKAQKTINKSNNPPIAPESESTALNHVTYERVCTETLDSLCDYFEELVENDVDLRGTDVSYGDGVLTVNLGAQFGIYVINRQTPNKQIWLSSPTSGPKRYDFIQKNAKETNGKWIYKHNGETMHELLQKEIAEILKTSNVNFLKLPYAGS